MLSTKPTHVSLNVNSTYTVPTNDNALMLKSPSRNSAYLRVLCGSTFYRRERGESAEGTGDAETSFVS